MSTKFLSPGWRMPRNANQSKSANYSLDFTGSERVNVSDFSSIPTGNSSRTVSAWFNSSYSSTGEPVIVSYGANANAQMFNIMLKGGSGADAGRLRFVGYNRDHTFTTADLRDKQWHHVAMTYNGTIVEAFLDGSSVGNFTPSSALNTGTSFFNIGIQWTSWQGQISQLCFFDYVLSSSQITTLWGGGTSVSNPMALPNPPKAYYPLGKSAWNGQYLAENNAIEDYVFDINGNSSKYFNLPKTSVGSDDFTFSFWVKPEPYAGGGGDAGDTLLGNTNGAPGANQWNMWIYEPTGKLNLVWYNQTSSAGNFMTTNFSFGAGTVNQEWTHVVLTRVGTTVTFYFNGVVDTATPGTLSSSSITLDDSSNATMRLPSPWGAPLYNQDGFYSNLLWHNVGLSSTEVETLYNYGSPIRTLASIPQSSNLKAWYKLDASEIYNSSSTEWEVNNAVSSYNNSLFVDNVFGNTSINGITMGSYSDTAGLSAISWSLWVNLKVLNSASGYSTLINGNSFSFSTDASNGGLNWKSRFVTTSNIDNDFTLSTALQSQGWVNIIATYDGTNAKFYLNTAEQGTQTGSGVLNTTSSLNLAYSYGSNSVDAYFSNFSIWNKALTTSDISEIYNSGVPGDLASHSSTSNLINWWKLNNLSSGLQDSKGSSNATTTGTSGSTTVQPGSVSTLNGLSSGMNQSNLVQSDLQTVAPYSKYAISFNGADDYIEGAGSVITGNNARTVSCWMKSTSTTLQTLFSLGAITGATSASKFAVVTRGSYANEIRVYTLGTTAILTYSGVNLYDDNWHNVVVTYSAQSYALYIDGIAQGTTNTGQDLVTESGFSMGRWYNANWMNGSLSNVSAWNTALTSAQVSEIYNQGLPGNLNSHSAYSNLVSWWQLGENSFFDGNDWIVADEKGTNNGTSTGMGVDALVNGVGTTANGVSTGMSEGSLIGDAPYSTANAISSGMALTARGTNVP